MKATLNNNVTAGVGRYPTTLLEAYTIANNWKRTTTYQGTTSSVFAALTKGDKPPPKKEPKKKSKDDTTKEETGKESDVSKKVFQGECIRCGKQGHRAKNCPHSEVIKRALEEAESNRALNTFANRGSNNNDTAFSSAFITVLRTNKNDPMRDRILLDNQAQGSNFRKWRPARRYLR